MRDEMIQRFKESFSSQKNAGFTLIEVAIVLIIIGILTVPLMTLYNNYLQQKIMLATSNSLAEANNAIQRFYLMNGAYPCPAGREIGPSSANYGDAACPTSGLAVGSCTSDGVCRVAGQTGGQTVLIGSLPFRTLEMQGDNTIDGYKSKLVYIISESLTKSATFNSNIKEVKIVDANDVQVQVVHGALVAPGLNKLGAYSIAGGLTNPCTGNTLDVENCNLDSTIRDSLYSESSGTNYFDDRVTTADWTLGKIWERVPASPDDIYSKNTGNVGIGTDTPSAKLEVGGDVRAESILAQQLCDKNGGNCFSTDAIAGAKGIALGCPNNQVMVGIDSGKALCSGVSINNMANQGCKNPGEYAYGFNLGTGTILCAKPTATP